MPRDYTDNPLGFSGMNSPQMEGYPIRPYKMQTTVTTKKTQKTPPNPAQSQRSGGKKRNRRGSNARQAPKIQQGRQPSQLAAAYASGQMTEAPRVHSTAVSTRIVHRELISKVVMTALFAVQKIPLNPGLATAFPWLSIQARAWETYRFNSLRFRYYTRVGSSATGSVILAPDYSAADPNPASEQIASTYRGTAEDASWKNITCSLSPESMHALGPKKFIRLGNLGANQDIKTYDVGSLFVCTVDGTPGPAGNLWVEYDVTFTNPQTPAGGSGGLYQRFVGSPGASINTANPLGTAPVISGPGSFATVSGNVVTFTVAGRYNVDLFMTASTSATMASSTLGGGAVSVDYGGTVGSGSTKLEDVHVFDAIVGSTITYPVTIVGTGSSDLNITPYMVVAPY